MHIGDEMEISKEREAFEAEFSKIKSDIAFWLHTWDEEMQGYNHPVMCWFWYMWQAKKQATPEGFVLLPKEVLNKSKRVVTLTCSELLEAFQFGAPDGESDEDQMATEMTIVWLEEGHSGKGYYAYYSELPEEGAIKLGEEQSHD